MICPICKGTNQCSARYPDSVCDTCLSTYGTKTKDGKDIQFGNACMTGGVYIVIEGKENDTSLCYVNGVQCYAEEARFGGIVIRPSNISLKKNI